MIPKVDNGQHIFLHDHSVRIVIFKKGLGRNTYVPSTVTYRQEGKFIYEHFKD